MTVNVPGPLALLMPKARTAHAPGDAGATDAADVTLSSPRSFADLLAAAQPRAEDAAPARDEKDPVDARGDDQPAAEALPPWLLPPAIESPRIAPVATGGVEREAARAAAGAARANTRGVAAPAEAGAAPPATGDVAHGDAPADAGTSDATPGAATAAALPAAPSAADDDARAAIARALAPVAAGEARPVPSAAATTTVIPAAGAARRAPERGHREPPAGAAATPSSPAATASPGTQATRPPPAAPATHAVPTPVDDPQAAPAREAWVDTPRAAPVPAAAAELVARATAPTAAREGEAAPPVTSAVATADPSPVGPPPPVTHGAERVPDPVAIHVDRPVAGPGWAEEVTGALAHAITVRHASAQLHLHPESMGPVDVRISVSGGEASVQLVAAHAATREALADALPMLRDLLGSQGLALGQAAVESRAQQDPSPSPPPHAAADGAAARAPAPVADTPATVARVLRLLDVFA